MASGGTMPNTIKDEQTTFNTALSVTELNPSIDSGNSSIKINPKIAPTEKFWIIFAKCLLNLDVKLANNAPKNVDNMVPIKTKININKISM